MYPSAKSRSTSFAFIGTRVMGLPFWAMMSALAMILYKEFHVSPLQLTFLVALKPASALFSVYWSSYLHSDRKNLVWSLTLANVLRFVPFLFFVWARSSWYIIFSFGLYMVLSRGSVPAWMELFKKHIPNSRRSKVFALGNGAEYLGTTVLPLLLGFILDRNHDAWRFLFPITAIIGITSTLFLLKIPALLSKDLKIVSPILHPWKRSFSLLFKNRAFAWYQLGFMLGGAGLMIIQPILPIFFIDNLQLSYTEIMLALTVCKGIGFTLTSPLWASFFNRRNIFLFSAVVAGIAALFQPLLLCAQSWVPLLYIAYISYGIMQAGSEMSWHMSAVSFSQKEESVAYSEVNILAVGLRGMIIPFLGSVLFAFTNTTSVLCAGSLLCLLGSSLLVSRFRRTYKEQKGQNAQ
ncbi:MAG: MFS transporter [Chlamydiales bacterium]